MNPYINPPLYYQQYQPYQSNNTSYIPCVFCHSTIPANAMSAHLAQCPSARMTAPPTVISTPFGTTQSIQYRRVIRVERKTVNDSSVQPTIAQTNSVPFKSQNKMIEMQNNSQQTSNLLSNQSTSSRIKNGENTNQYTYKGLQQTSSLTNQNNVIPSNQRQSSRIGVESGRVIPRQRSTQQATSQTRTYRPSQVTQNRVPYVNNSGVQQPHVNQSRVQQQVNQSRVQQQVNQSRVQQQVNQSGVQQHVDRSRVQSHMNQSGVQQQVERTGVQQQVNQPRIQQHTEKLRIKQAEKDVHSAFQPNINKVRMQSRIQPQSIQPRVQQLQQHIVQPKEQPLMNHTNNTIGRVETINPGTLSDRIKMFETNNNAPIPVPSQTIPQKTYISSQVHNTVGEVEVIKPESMAQRKAMFEKAMIKSMETKPTKVNQQSSISQPSLPPKPTYQQLSTIETTPQSTQPPHQQSPPIEHFEKKDERNPTPNKLIIPKSVEGQLSLSEVLQKRMITQQTPTYHQPSIETTSQPPSLPLKPTYQQPLIETTPQPIQPIQPPHQQLSIEATTQPPSLPPKPTHQQLSIEATTQPIHQQSPPIEHFEKKDERNSTPNKLIIPKSVEGQLSLSEVLQKRTITQQTPTYHQPSIETTTQPPQPIHQQSSTIEHFEKKDERNPTPNKLIIPKSVEGQLSLSEVLQKRMTTNTPTYSKQNNCTMQRTENIAAVQHVVNTSNHMVENQTTISYQASQQLSIPCQTKIEKPVSPRSPQIVFEDSSIKEINKPSVEPIYTAHNAYLIQLNKEDIKIVFACESVLPFEGFSNVIMCIYPDQLCFYYYNTESSQYEFITNILRVACVNTRLDRQLSISNSIHYGILIMDKSEEYLKGVLVTYRQITSIWFTSASERDHVYQLISYFYFLNKQAYFKRIMLV